MKIAILGGDARSSVVAKLFAREGAEVSVFALPHSCTHPPSPTAEAALAGAEAVILPLPVSRDGEHLNCSLPEPPRVSAMLSLAKSGTLVLGGLIDDRFIEEGAFSSLEMFDYFECEMLQIKNARATAEGALAIAITSMPRTIFASEIGVTGYGRTARRLTQLFLALGAKVTVCARSEDALTWAETDGAKTHLLTPGDPVGGGAYDMIFNTVPAKLFTRAVLASLPPRVLLVDLATPVCYDEAAAAELGCAVRRAGGLPGRYSPESSGEYIFDCAKRIIARYRSERGAR